MIKNLIFNIFISFFVFVTLSYSQEKPSIDYSKIQEKEGVFFGQTEVISSTLIEGMEYLLAPVAVSYHFLEKRRQEGKSNKEAFIETLEDGGGAFLVGYIVIIIVNRVITKTYFQIDYDAFIDKSSQKMKQNPRRVLYINAIPKDNYLEDQPELNFNKLYKDHPDAKIIKVHSLNNLIDKLNALPKNKKFDRIEIMAHGNPGKIKLGNEDDISENDLKKLQNAKLKITNPDAEIRFTTCSLAANTYFQPVGERMLKRLGELLLSDGGKVIGSTKYIVAIKQTDKLFFQYLTGIGPLIDIISKIPQINRDYSQVRQGILDITIEPKKNKRHRCLINQLKRKRKN